MHFRLTWHSDNHQLLFVWGNSTQTNNHTHGSLWWEAYIECTINITMLILSDLLILLLPAHNTNMMLSQNVCYNIYTESEPQLSLALYEYIRWDNLWICSTGTTIHWFSCVHKQFHKDSKTTTVLVLHIILPHWLTFKTNRFIK